MLDLGPYIFNELRNHLTRISNMHSYICYLRFLSRIDELSLNTTKLPNAETNYRELRLSRSEAISELSNGRTLSYKTDNNDSVTNS